MIFLGDILVAINGNSIKNLRFADQIEIIKNSRRPINLSFIPDRKKEESKILILKNKKLI